MRYLSGFFIVFLLVFSGCSSLSKTAVKPKSIEPLCSVENVSRDKTMCFVNKPIKVKVLKKVEKKGKAYILAERENGDDVLLPGESMSVKTGDILYVHLYKKIK